MTTTPAHLHGNNHAADAETRDPLGLQGLRILVTGGASGIGLATATYFHEAGAKVATLDAAESPAMPFDTTRADLTDDQAVRRAVAAAILGLNGLDVVVNCAGIGARGRVEDNDDGEWRNVLEVNLLGVVRVTRAALPALRSSRSAAIVNVCSIAATSGLPQRALYSASKGALLSLTLAMAADMLVDGIRVNAVNPGTVDTPWVQRLLASSADPATELAALQARQPHGRLISSEEVAHAIGYLASRRSGSTTGTWLAVDGGMDRLRVPPSASVDAR